VVRLTGTFFDTSVLVAGMVDLGRESEAAIAVIDAVADARIRDPRTAWHCCLEFFSVTTRLPEETPGSRRRLTAPPAGAASSLAPGCGLH
jgi:hypothetical protein